MADFTFVLSRGKEDVVRVTYSGSTHSLHTDGREIRLEAGDVPSIHAYVDGSVAELILGQRVGYTKRFYSGSAGAPDLKVEVTGAPVGLDAWSVRPISPNRLTTPAIG